MTRPVVAVHLVTLWEAVCHSCGWESGPDPVYERVAAATEAHALICEGPRPG